MRKLRHRRFKKLPEGHAAGREGVGFKPQQSGPSTGALGHCTTPNKGWPYRLKELACVLFSLLYIQEEEQGLELKNIHEMNAWMSQQVIAFGEYIVSAGLEFWKAKRTSRNSPRPDAKPLGSCPGFCSSLFLWTLISSPGYLKRVLPHHRAVVGSKWYDVCGIALKKLYILYIYNI